MPYTQVDHDAIKKAVAMAPLLGVTPQHVTGGLTMLWQWCWAERKAEVSAIQLEGFMGLSHPRLVEAMVGFGFVEPKGEQFRVRGAGEFLRLQEVVDAGRRKGGLASKKHLRNSSADPRLTVGRRSADARLDLGSTSALTPDTIHQSPDTIHKQEKEDSSLWDAPKLPFSKLPMPDLQAMNAATAELGPYAVRAGKLGDPGMPAPIQAVFDHWVTARHKTKGMKLDPKRQKLIAQSLRSYSQEQLCKAIDGVALDPWPERVNQDGLGIILRPDNIDKFLALADAHAPGPFYTYAPGEKAAS